MTRIRPASSCDRAAFTRFLACAVPLLAVAIPVRAAETAPAAAPEARDHVIFVGLDLTLASPKTAGRLVDLHRNSAELATAEGPARISLSAVNSVSLQRQMRISEGQVTIADVQTERTITPMLDPKRLALEQSMDLSYAQEQRTVAAYSQLGIAEMQSSSSPDGAQLLLENQARARNEVAAAVNDPRGVGGSPGSMLHHSESGNVDAKSDAFRVSFAATTAAPTTGVYAALVVRFTVPGTTSNSATFVRFSELPELGPRPRSVTLQCGGLPIGYKVEGYEVHLYQARGELATSLSEKAVAVTRSEAVQYLVLRHQMENPHASLPPRIMTEFLPPDVAEHLSPAARKRSAEVGVAADGTVNSVKLDEQEPRDVDAYVAQALRDARFLPALVNGTPTATTTTVTFAELVR